jgi:single-strand DNA-binding protein
MSNGLNRVILIGNLGQDPELRHTTNSSVLNIRMATTESYMSGKEKKEVTEWHTVTVWGKRAKGLSKILAKGDRICVEGRLQTRSWEAKDGSTRYATSINASNIVLLGSKSTSQAATGNSQSAPAGNNDVPDDSFPGGDDDIPF